MNGKQRIKECRVDKSVIEWAVDFILKLLITGAHEPPKAAKEHATECHHNPNYVITFELNWLLSRVVWFQITRLWFSYMETNWL